MPTLHWIGKEKVINHHLDVPYRVLDHQYAFNGEEESGNKIIHGDNLEALKSLLPEYEGKIKCIYIDPPYNTGNEGWVYNDNVNDPKIKKWLGQVVGKEAEDLTRHDKWLCMMYPRLKLLHKLLAEDGTIFISIDDNEHSNLKLMLDEIFGTGNFIANICHRSRQSISNDLILSPNHNLILLYAKSQSLLFKNRFEFRLDVDLNGFNLNDNDGKGPYKLVPVDGPGGAAKGNPYYEFLGVLGYWRYSQDTMEELYNNGDIVKRRNSLSRKYYLSKAESKGGKSTTTWWDDAGTATNGTNLIKNIFNGEKIFETPKPIELIERVVKLALSKDKNSIILDSFAGSGTTAHAVLNLNKQDGGNRKFICIEMEEYAETITAVRVKRVINGYGDKEGTGGSFDYYELGPALFNEDNEINELVGVEKLRQYIYYTETKSPLTAPSPSERAGGEAYLLNKHNDTAYYFYYEQDSVTTLNHDFLSTIKTKAEQYVIYADNCLLTKEFMTKHHIIFKKIPRDITKF